jgi:cellulose synthase/poly-beta-1,6-N-acetylglucosamine synthase-like glycosyltransferase
MIIIVFSLFIVAILFIKDLHKMIIRNRFIININKKAAPLVSILIPARNEELHIEKCIKNIVKSTYTNYEIIVISDGSTDNTFEIVERLAQLNPKIKVIKKQPQGKNAALNEGLIWAEGDIIVLVDADTFVEREWLEHLIEPIVDGRASATSGNPFPYKCNWVTSYHCLCNLFRIIQGKKGLFGAGTIAIKKEVIEKIGNFDENAHAVDDFVLSRSVKTMGYDIEIVEKAEVKTDFSSTFIEYLKIEIRWMRSLFHYQINKKPLLRQILEPKDLIKSYNPNIYSIFFFSGIFLFFLSNNNIFILLKITYIFTYSTALLRQISKPILLFLHTNNKYWLKYLMVPVLFEILSHFITLYAMLTYYKFSNYFLGPRKFYEK